MKNILPGYLNTKSLISFLTIGAVFFGYLCLTVISTAACAQSEEITEEYVTVSVLKGRFKTKHKEKITHESIKDPSTGKEVRSIHTQYYPNGDIRFKEEYQYDLKTGGKTDFTRKIYDEGGILRQENVFCFDPNTGDMKNQIQTVFQANGEISYFIEFSYSPGWKMPTKKVDINYYNGKVFSKTEDFWDVNTHEKIHSVSVMYGDANGNISSETEEDWDANTGKMTRHTNIRYNSKDGKIEEKEEKIYDHITETLISKTIHCYDSEGSYLEEYRYIPEGEYPASAAYTKYDTNNNVTKKEEYCYDPKTGEIVNQ